jgi:hypothetical protein
MKWQTWVISPLPARRNGASARLYLMSGLPGSNVPMLSVALFTCAPPSSGT